MMTKFLRGRSENGYGFKKPSLKTGVKNDIFWSERGSGFGEPGGAPPSRIPRSTPSEVQLINPFNKVGKAKNSHKKYRFLFV